MTLFFMQKQCYFSKKVEVINIIYIGGYYEVRRENN